MNVFYLDREIKTNISGYQSLIKLYDDIVSKSTSKIIFISFKNTIWFEANLTSILGAIMGALHDAGFKVDYGDFTRSIESIFSRNGFLNMENNKVFDASNTFISYNRFTPHQGIEFNEYINKELLQKPNFPKHTKLVEKNICRNIFEIFENAITHGKCSYVYTCGQYFPRQEPAKLNMTIVDHGITIVNNVNEYHIKRGLSKIFNSQEAIQWAIISGNTTKTEITGGLGLGLLMEFIRLNKGTVHIVSSDGILIYKNGTFSTTKIHSSFPGTIVNMEFNFDDDSNYMMKSEEENYNFENIF